MGDAVRAFAVYAIRSTTRLGSRVTIAHALTPLDTDDDPCELLARSRKLPGRIVVIRTSDGARIAARLASPGDRP